MAADRCAAGQARPGGRGGGTGASATLNHPRCVATDQHGNILIAAGKQVRVIAATSGTFYGVPMLAAEICTVAGTGARGFSGDGGPAQDADLADPSRVAASSTGALLIGDGSRIRQVTG